MISYFSRLPKHLRQSVLDFAFGPVVEVEISQEGYHLTKHSTLLNISTQTRHDVLEACDDPAFDLHLLYIFRSPAAFQTAVDKINPCIVRIVLLARIDDDGLILDEREGSGHEGPHVLPLYADWRQAFRTLPDHINIEHIYFDLAKSFKIDFLGVRSLINNLSAIVRQRTHGQAKQYVYGCQTVKGQKDVESSVLDVVLLDAQVSDSETALAERYPDTQRKPPPFRVLNSREYRHN